MSISVDISTFQKSLAVGLVVGIASLTASSINNAKEFGQPNDLTGQFLPGVNLAGAEFGAIRRPDGARSKHGWDYFYPVSRFARNYTPEYFLAKGMKLFRLPFLWERLQPNLDGEFDKGELALLRASVQELTEKGGWVVLDLHNYARYNAVRIGDGDVTIQKFAEAWRGLASEFGSNPKVLFGLMNEPHDISTLVWTSAAAAAIASIRDAGASNYILVGGNDWSAARNWYQRVVDESSAKALLTLKDPLNRLLFEAHTYFDRDSSGTHRDCVSETIGIERLEPFTRWLKENQKVGFIGEFGASSSPVCLAALAKAVQYIQENKDHYLGWSYWAAGPAWPPDYMYLIEPRDGKDAPQMSAINPHLSN